MEEEPEAYRIGDQPFLGLTIYLDSKPLIPRVETEWWTNELLETLMERIGEFSERPDRGGGRQSKFSAENYAAPKTPLFVKFLDLCSGSGAIGCAALKYLPNAQVYFGEIDPAHKLTIEKNIFENKLDASRAHIGIGDLFAPFGDLRFDVIAANPPYIPDDRALPPSVADHEPGLALRAGKNGLAVIRRIIKELPKRLAPGGMAWIEVDEEQAEEAAALCESAGMKAELRTDQYGKPRVVVVSFRQ